MEKSSFFNSVGGDRVYKAEEWAEYFASFIGNGVFPVPSNGLQVEANSSAGVVIRAGRAWINGYFYFNTDDLNVKLNTADGVLNRIDRIVIRWDLTARTISAEVKSSAPSNNPTTPALQRDADAYELCLADVYVRAGSTAVLQSDITDQRYNSGLCGVVKGTVDQIDASMLAKQFNDYAELFKQETKRDFEAWFEEIRGILSEDLAGSLALAIDDINRSKGQPGGIATLNSSGKLAQMPTAEDIAAIPLSQKGIANGIATLNSSGKLAQMPTAADVGAASINIRQFDITPLVPDNGGDLMCRCWINPWHEAHLMIRWSLRTPLTGTIDFAKLPDECLPIMGFDTTCVLRSPSSGIEAGIVNIGWGGQISICRSTTSVNDTFTMLCANINYHTYY